MTLNPKIFKAYDIRGIYPSELDEDVAYRVGRSFVSLLAPEEIIIGRDMRLSGASLETALIEGILDQGANVISIGMVSTDQFYFACATEKLPGLMITASHNPKQYNGFKMVKEMPYLLSGDSGIQDIRRIAEKAQFQSPRKSRKTDQSILP